jgi:hydroxyacylglutathione hydrolase
MSAVPQSTVGYEKLFNWAFGAKTEEEFVTQVLADQPEPPKYFAEMKRLNRDGPPILDGLRRPPRLEGTRLPELLAAGATIVDARPSEVFAARHIPGTVHIPLGRSFTTWAGWLLSYDKPFYLLVSGDSAEPLDVVLRDLALIGLDGARVVRLGRASRWGRRARLWQHGGHRTGRAGTPAGAGRGGGADVRGQAEWKAGRSRRGEHSSGYLLDQLDDVPVGPARAVLARRRAVGHRASLLEAKGLPT